MKKAILFAVVQKWAAGVQANTAALNLVHYSASSILSDLGNAQQTELSFQASRSATLAASNSVLTARDAATLYVGRARTNLKTYLGERWSTAWTQAGFVNNTLVIPTSTAGVLALTRALQAYFTSNPSHQNAAANVTALMAGPLVTALNAAVTALNNAKFDQRTRKDTRDAAEKTMMTKYRASRQEVESVLPKEDPRWLQFIDAVPADARAPEAVSAIDGRPGLPGHVSLHWLDSLRAERYAIEAVVNGAGAFTPVATVQDTVADLEFPPGATVRLRVKARNAAGESGASPVVEVQVPVAVAA